MPPDSIWEYNFSFGQTMFFVSVAILGVNLLGFVCVGVLAAFAGTKHYDGVLVRNMRILSTLLVGPLYIPVRRV